MKAMILAAGKGTRMRPLTDTRPKVLIEVGGMTLLEHTILYLKYFGVTEIIVNVHHHAVQIIDFLKGMRKHNIKILISDESSGLLDTGGGLLKASWFFDDGKPFVLTACDAVTDLNLGDMYDFHLAKRPLATLAVKKRPSSRDFLFDGNCRLCGWRNNNTGLVKMSVPTEDTEGLGFSAVHIIDPFMFSLIDKSGPFSITDAYLELAANYEIIGYRHDQSRWVEFGRIENLNNQDFLDILSEVYRKFHP